MGKDFKRILSSLIIACILIFELGTLRWRVKWKVILLKKDTIL